MVSPAATGYCEVNSNCLNTPVDSVMAFTFLGLLAVAAMLILIGSQSLIRRIPRRRRSLPGQEIGRGSRVFPAEAISIRPHETLEEYVRRVSH